MPHLHSHCKHACLTCRAPSTHLARRAELLKRTEEKREQRKKERLDDYYKRNFGDYFEVRAPGAEEA